MKRLILATLLALALAAPAWAASVFDDFERADNTDYHHHGARQVSYRISFDNWKLPFSRKLPMAIFLLPW